MGSSGPLWWLTVCKNLRPLTFWASRHRSVRASVVPALLANSTTFCRGRSALASGCTEPWWCWRPPRGTGWIQTPGMSIGITSAEILDRSGASARCPITGLYAYGIGFAGPGGFCGAPMVWFFRMVAAWGVCALSRPAWKSPQSMSVGDGRFSRGRNRSPMYPLS